MHVIGTSQKDEALKYLPEGTICYLASFGGHNRYVVELPDGQVIARERSSLRAWNRAKEWALEPENSKYNRFKTAIEKGVYKKK